MTPESFSSVYLELNRMVGKRLLSLDRLQEIKGLSLDSWKK